MIDEIQRELTTMEYVVLGLLSTAPQTGYTLIHALELTNSRWSASAGAIYPALKRLERAGIIQGDIQIVRASRLRKVYQITDLGEKLLDNWLRSVPNVDLSDHSILLIKFLFAEHRLSHDEIVRWLNDYAHCMDIFEGSHRDWHNAQLSVSSAHQQLLLQATMMEWKMQRDWIQIVRQQLLTMPEPHEDAVTEQQPEALTV